MQNTVSALPRWCSPTAFGFGARPAAQPRSDGTIGRTMLLAAALLTRAAPAPAAPGDLDATFGDHGRVSLAIGVFGAQGRSVIEQPDGKLVIAGVAAGQFTIARLTRAGALDTGFASDGVVSLDFGGFDDVAYVVVRQSDGKLVVAGAAGVAGAADEAEDFHEIGLVRFTSNGTLDASFGTNGKVTLDLGGTDDFASGLVEQPDGKLVVAGATNSSGTYRMAFARFNADGTTDTSFGDGGANIVDLGAGTESRATWLVRQADGGLVAGGMAVASGGTSDFAVVRLTADGDLDSTFDGDGWGVTDIGGGADSASSVALQPDGKLLLVGSASSTGDGLPDAALLRLNVDGSIDQVFGSAGKTVVDLGDQSTLGAVVTQSNGKLVATGTRGPAICCSDDVEPTDMILVRFDADGSLDKAYGVDGVTTADFGRQDFYAISTGVALIQQVDGRYVAVGSNSAGDVAIARFDDQMDSAGLVGFAKATQYVDETARSVSLRVRRTGGRTGAVTVDYDTSAGSAREGVDYLAAHGTLSWADGDASDRVVDVDVIDDDEREQREDFTLVLSNASGGAGLASRSVSTGIGSEDGPGYPQFFDGLTPIQVAERAVTIHATVRRVGGSEGDLTVRYATEGSTAVAGSDFVAKSGTLSWGDGDSSPRSISVEILDDSIAEGPEDFAIRLGEPTGGLGGLLSGIQLVRIVANDGMEHGRVVFRPGAATVAEGRASVALTVSRIDGSTGAVSVDYATSAKSATLGADFDAASGKLTWPDGDVKDRTINVNVANDSTRESDETFDVILSNATGGASLAFPASATVTITDDDSSGAGNGRGGGGGGGGCFIAAAALLLLWRRRFHVTRSRANGTNMRDKSAASTVLLALLSCVSPPVSNAAAPGPHSLAPGEVAQVLSLRPLIDIAEGIAIDRRGHIFISNTRLENDTRVCEILELTRDGTVSVFATLDPTVEDSFGVGVVGLALDARDNLYAALSSFKAATHGVWRIRRDGVAERLAGSKRMLFANALTFDSRGNLYVTDSVDGAIWLFPRKGRGRLWIRHPLLAPNPVFGANGIAFVPPNNLYVANTDRALIARIRIRPDGRPAEPELVAAGFELLGIDGLAADARGTLHAVIVVSVALGTSPLVKVDPESGRITASRADPSAFDLPTSLAFGRGPLDHKSVFVINSGLLPEGRPETAPGVIQAGVGLNSAR